MTAQDSPEAGRRPAPAFGRLLLRGPDGDITARLIWPAAIAAEPGGVETGFTRTSMTVLVGLDQPAPLDRDNFGLELAVRSGAAVLSMPWHLATAQASVEYALGWLADHADDLDANLGPLVIVGLGAAANAAATAARSARDSAWPALARHLLVLPEDGPAMSGPWSPPESLAGVCACTLVLGPDASTPLYADALARAGVPVRQRRLSTNPDGQLDVGSVVAAVADDLAGHEWSHDRSAAAPAADASPSITSAPR